MSFQTIFFERFIACFKVRGNVGFFIITIDFVGYLGTLCLLLFKEFQAPHIDWTSFYNSMSVYIGIACCLAFAGSIVYIINKVYNAKDFKMIKGGAEKAGKAHTCGLSTAGRQSLTTA